MLRFKQFILEGGNIQLGDKANPGPKAAPFDSSKRESTAPDIHHALWELNNKVKQEHGVEPFGAGGKALHTQSTYKAGSTEFFFDKSIPQEKYHKAIPKTGDIDTLIDERHKDKLESTLGKMPSGSKLGNTTYLGWKKGAGESHILLKHPNHKDPIQVDLNHVKYEKEEPDEFAKFSRSGGSIDDRAKGIKGMHRNLLIHSVAKTKGLKWSNMKGLKTETAAPSEDGIKDPKTISRTLFGADVNMKSFSDVAAATKKHIPKEKHKEVAANFISDGKDESRVGPHKHLLNALDIK